MSTAAWSLVDESARPTQGASPKGWTPIEEPSPTTQQVLAGISPSGQRPSIALPPQLAGPPLTGNEPYATSPMPSVTTAPGGPASSLLPTVGMGVGGFVGGPAGGALGLGVGEMGKAALEGQPLDLSKTAQDIGLTYLGGKALDLAAPVASRAISATADAMGLPTVARFFGPADAQVVADSLAKWKRAVVPNGATAADHAAIDEAFGRSAKYIADAVRTSPIDATRGLLSGSETTDALKSNLYDTYVNPVVSRYGPLQTPNTDVAAQIRNSFTDLDAATPRGRAAAKAADDFARNFDSPMSIAQKQSWVQQLNSDRAVSRFYSMDPGQQSAAMIADPSLRAKLTALDALRGNLFDSIDNLGGEATGQQFREARKDYAALKTVGEFNRDARIATPGSVGTRALNTLRAVGGRDLFGAATHAGLFTPDPNALAAESFNSLGRSSLGPPPLVPPPATPAALPPAPLITPPPDLASPPYAEWRTGNGTAIQPLAANRQLPPAGGTSGPRTVEGSTPNTLLYNSRGLGAVPGTSSSAPLPVPPPPPAPTMWDKLWHPAYANDFISALRDYNDVLQRTINPDQAMEQSTAQRVVDFPRDTYAKLQDAGLNLHQMKSLPTTQQVADVDTIMRTHGTSDRGLALIRKTLRLPLPKGSPTP